MSAILVFAIAALASFGLRSSMVLAGGERLSDAWAARLPLVAPVMLSAIVASSVLVESGRASVPSPAVLAAVIGAVVGVRRTESLHAAFVVGFPVFWVMSALGLS